jgi:hypothetical protein
VNSSIAAIHFGISGFSPGRGRPRHCLTATESRSSPNSNTTTSTVVLVSLLESAPPATNSTMTDTATSPSTHPAAKADPVERARGVPSMRITATMGIGLSATPTAEGNRSPIASPSMSRPLP